MNGYKIALLAWYAIGALVMVSMIGRPRGPITPRLAVQQLVFLSLAAFLVVKA